MLPCPLPRLVRAMSMAEEGRRQLATIRPSMQSPDFVPAERQAIHSALSRIERRLRLNRFFQTAALCGGVVLLGLITWRALMWLGGALPAASALVVLIALIASVALMLLLAQGLLRNRRDVARAASEADQRGGLHDEMVSALWFMHGDTAHRPPERAWIESQLQRAARTAGRLQVTQLIPLRLPGGLLAGLLTGVMVLALTWGAAPLTTAQEMRVAALGIGSQNPAQLQALRRIIEALPPTEARRKLEAALATLERGTASADERRQAMTEAQQAVEQIKLDAAVSREGLQKLSQTLASQEGMEEAAEALAKGDAQRAAELIAKAQTVESGNADTPVPPDATGETPHERATHPLTDAVAEAQGARPSAEALQIAADRLKAIARELKAANFVNEAWKEVRGPDMQNARTGVIAAGRHDEQQAKVDGTPSPGSSEKPMGGGTQMREGVAGEGLATEEQDGGTRMGGALGDGEVDPLLGERGALLDEQLKQHALQGQEDASRNADQEWFYSASQKRSAQTARRVVEARARFAEANASVNGGIAVRHRQVTKDYFKQRPEVAR